MAKSFLYVRATFMLMSINRFINIGQEFQNPLTKTVSFNSESKESTRHTIDSDESDELDPISGYSITQLGQFTKRRWTFLRGFDTPHPIEPTKKRNSLVIRRKTSTDKQTQTAQSSSNSVVRKTSDSSQEKRRYQIL